MATRQAFIGVGANLGDRAETIAAAMDRLRTWPGVVAMEISALYETDPEGIVDQPRFLNSVVAIETTLTPEELLNALQVIEREFGRVRGERWGPRTLDLDLLMFEGESRATPELQLPHPRMFDRAFVAVPLRELLKRPRFKTAEWTAVRERLAASKLSEAGVKILKD